ncbi:hypothetical protein Mgra_00010304 [Meloidogyne graminicola]|uniref:Uncharacterized protein n=1 Tax=Meloidogyne graminicola TaxID=189291 RepID=A0A8S9Z5J0_9BILA|nr:hypothetical protein Mgra_00010304 [Meloidogyne graminicola]
MTHSLEKDQSLPPSKHDMMFSDINDEELKGIGQMMEIENLSVGKFSLPYFPVNSGKINSPNYRLMICLVCQKFKDPTAPIINVWFVVNTGSVCTFINEKTMKALSGSENVPDSMDVAIQDPNISIECYLSHSHFKEANVLGMMAMMQLGVTIEGMEGSGFSWRLTR